MFSNRVPFISHRTVLPETDATGRQKKVAFPPGVVLNTAGTIATARKIIYKVAKVPVD